MPSTPQTVDPAEVLDQIAARADAATIADAPGYEVRRDGTVWSLRNWRGMGYRMVSTVDGAGGYPKVRLSLPDGRRINRYVHRLVAQAFLGPRPAGAQIRHLNGDRSDARASNLAWGSALENAADRDRHGTTARGSRNSQARLSEAQVRAIRERAMAGELHYAIAASVGCHKSTISRIVRGDRWAHVPTRAAITSALGGEA